MQYLGPLAMKAYIVQVMVLLSTGGPLGSSSLNFLSANPHSGIKIN